jgi:hypothetical protein
VPSWIALRAAPALWRRVPWKTVWIVSVWLAEKGRDRVNENLTEKERSEFLNLLTRSKGRPSNLPQRDKTRLRNIAGKAIRG